MPGWAREGGKSAWRLFIAGKTSVLVVDGALATGLGIASKWADVPSAAFAWILSVGATVAVFASFHRFRMQSPAGSETIPLAEVRLLLSSELQHTLDRIHGALRNGVYWGFHLTRNRFDQHDVVLVQDRDLFQRVDPAYRAINRLNDSIPLGSMVTQPGRVELQSVEMLIRAALDALR